VTRDELVEQIRTLFAGVAEAVIAQVDNYNAARVRELVAALTNGVPDGRSPTTGKKTKADALQGDLHLNLSKRPRKTRRDGRRAQAPRLDEGKQVVADPPRPRAARRDDDAAATDVTTKGTPRARSVMKCGKCGEPGKRADGCGKTHNVPTDSDERTPPPITCGPVRANRSRCSRAPQRSYRLMMTSRSLPS
jgi:hypothetical protein